MRRLGFLFFVISAALVMLFASASPVRAASLDGPPQIAGLQFDATSIAVSGLHLVKVAVLLRLKDMDGVDPSATGICDSTCRTPAVYIVSTTGSPRSQRVVLGLASGTVNDGWWQGTIHVGSLDDGQLRVSIVEAFDTQSNKLFADPASSGYDPRLDVTGTDQPAISAGYSPSVVTYGDGIHFQGRMRHRDTGAGWSGVTLSIYVTNGPTEDLVKRVVTDSAGYWGIYLGPGGGIAPGNLPAGSYTILSATIPGPGSLQYIQASEWFTVVDSSWRQAPVRWRVWSQLASTRIRLGTSTTVSGSVAPSGQGATTASLQRLVSGMWKTVATAPIHTSGRFYLTAHPPSQGYQRYRVLIPAGSYRSNTTPAMTLYVY